MAIKKHKFAIWKIALTGISIYLTGIGLILFLDARYHFLYMLIAFAGFFIIILGFVLQAKKMFSDDIAPPKKKKQPWE